ncbi:unnamed protein product [Psylliodes chrysocephalus]|uniref:Copper transport protein ATOX1 n=1 Tax=Psylliodes chrysocephalus TaxID=3402493 RepID=A0A9P0G3G7_9CUCU|nr:unnamed protein product [Psylliodes chrysocephala]
MSKVYEFNVKMTCDGCSGAVDRVLGKLKGKGVDEVIISLEEQNVKVKSSLSAEEILEIIKKTGKEVNLISTT